MIFCVVFLLLFSILDKAKKQAQIPEPAIGSPKSYTDQKLIEKTSIDQIVSDGRYLYVLYGEHDGTVAMYTLSGVFQKAFVFYKHLNGVFRLATEEPYLYVMDKRENIYVFENGAFTCFLEKNAAKDITGKLDFEGNSENYSLRKGSVWYVDENAEKCIIYRQPYTVLYQNNLDSFIIYWLVAGIGLLRIYANRKKKLQ